MADNEKCGARMAELKCLYSNRGIISVPPILYLIGYKKTEGKCCVKTWTVLLAELCHPGSPQVNLGKDLTETERGRRGDDMEKECICLCRRVTGSLCCRAE